ncbi:MAG: GNAT family protein [Candidatus Promineifilaceae bacterium]|nr:GNAT family protein [Candidatus Promineifilaceae bacterium]
MNNKDQYFWQGEKIRLRPMRADDGELWLADEQSDSEGVRFLNSGITLPRSEHDAREFMQQYAEFNNKEERIMFSIETLEGQLVGGINIHSMNEKNGTFETGSRIYRAYRGQGYFFEAKVIVLRYAFHELRFQKYNLHTMETNEAMIRHAARLGCQAEGRVRRDIYTNGRYYDELIFGLTREEFDELLARLERDRNSGQ